MTDAIIEAAARAIYDFDSHPMPWSNEIEEKRNDYRELATTVLAAVTPLIRAAALEEAALVAEECPEYPGEVGTGDRIAAAIRALKERP